MSAKAAATIFVGLTAIVIAFQIALVCGAPWGAFAMGGGVKGAYPLGLRLAAVIQIAVLGCFALIVLSRAGMIVGHPLLGARWPAWGVAGLLGVSLVLNIITPSPLERLIWSPVALGLFVTAVRVAVAR